jgi:hypothetical protein
MVSGATGTRGGDTVISVSSAFQTAIAEETVKLAELYKLDLADGTSYYYTTHQQDIVWDSPSNTYSSVQPLERKDIGYRHTGEFDEVEVAMSNIAGDLFDTVHLNVLENALLTIKRIRWDQTYASDEEYILFIGTVDVRFNRKVLSLSCRPYIDSLNIMVPRHLFQEPCNHRLFDPGCELSRTAYAYAGAATDGTRTTLEDTTRGTVYKVSFDAGDEDLPIEIGDTVTGQTGAGTGVVVNVIYITAATGSIWYVEQTGVQFVDDEELQNAGADSVVCNGAPAEDTTYYEMGELEMTSGNNSGSRRPILTNSSDTITVMWPFVVAIDAADTYNIYPGCDQTTSICLGRFNNADNFRGFPYIPRFEEAMT